LLSEQAEPVQTSPDPPHSSERPYTGVKGPQSSEKAHAGKGAHEGEGAYKLQR